MRLRHRTLVVAVAGLLGAVAADVAGGATPRALALLGAGVVLGELMVLRLEDGTGVPLSYAVMLVLASGFGATEGLATVGAALAVAAVLRPVRGPWYARLRVAAQRLAVVAATFLAYRAVRDATGERETLAALLVALGAAAVAQLAVDEGVRWAARQPSGFGAMGRVAWLAVGSSGMLMAVAYRGVDGKGDVGIWAPVLFSVPLLAALYSFERLRATASTFHQTVEALAMAPELAGFVRRGHGERVAALAVAVGAELGLPSGELEHLRTAALLHHLGQVTLEDPEAIGRPHAPAQVAATTAGMLRVIEPLAPAGTIIAGPETEGRGEHARAAQVLRVASAFDDFGGGDPASDGAALAALQCAPGYTYDPGVLAALERVLERAGDNPSG